MEFQDTIFALATPVGGAVALIRISGEKSLDVLKKIFTGRVENRFLSYGKIIDENGETLDECMAVYMKKPHTYTGEDTVEISIHGGVAVAQSVCELISKSGAVPAQAGEFTKRAFMNGNLDLVQAEAVMDIINASAKKSAQSALYQLDGKLSEKLENIENLLIDALSGIDAAIDYPEELEEDTFSALPNYIDTSLRFIDELIENGLKSRCIREGIRVCIAGRPNVGKSSLLNSIIGSQRAIVTNIEGTTRDIIEESININSVPVRIVDTAGIRKTDDIIENIGIEKSYEAIENSDIVLLAFDASEKLTDYDFELLNKTKDKKRIAVLCKSDLDTVISKDDFDFDSVLISSITYDGIDELKNLIVKSVVPSDENAVITNTRHIDLLSKAKQNLISAKTTSEIDCIATDIRSALENLSTITGKYVDNSVIDRIFERFCVGK